MFDKIGDRDFIAAVTRVREENKDNIAGYRVGVLLRKYASLASVRKRGYGASPRLEDVPVEDRPSFLAELGVPADTNPTLRLSDQISKPANALFIRLMASRWASAISKAGKLSIRTVRPFSLRKQH